MYGPTALQSGGSIGPWYLIVVLLGTVVAIVGGVVIRYRATAYHAVTNPEITINPGIASSGSRHRISLSFGPDQPPEWALRVTYGVGVVVLAGVGLVAFGLGLLR